MSTLCLGRRHSPGQNFVFLPHLRIPWSFIRHFFKNSNKIHMPWSGSSDLFLNMQLSSVKCLQIIGQPIPRTGSSCKTEVRKCLKTSWLHHWHLTHVGWFIPFETYFFSSLRLRMGQLASTRLATRVKSEPSFSPGPWASHAPPGSPLFWHFCNNGL